MTVCFECSQPATLQCPDCHRWWCRDHIENNVPGREAYEYLCIECARRIKEPIEQAEREEHARREAEEHVREVNAIEYARRYREEQERKSECSCSKCHETAHAINIYRCLHCNRYYCENHTEAIYEKVKSYRYGTEYEDRDTGKRKCSRMLCWGTETHLVSGPHKDTQVSLML